MANDLPTNQHPRPTTCLSPRRRFLKTALALPLMARLDGQESGSEILPGLRIVPGAVNTGLFERNGKILMIDSGEMGGPADWCLYTHHHRDQASRAASLASAGARLIVPTAERHFFDDAFGFWDSAEALLDHSMDFRPHVFTLRESVPVARAVTGGDTHPWQGLQFQVIDTPGHTAGSVTYIVEIAGKRVAFTGDLIFAPGQIWEMYSLQKKFPKMRSGYWGFGGAVPEVKASLDRVLAAKPDILIPSHGAPIHDPPAAVAQLKDHLDDVMNNYFVTAGWRISPMHKGEYPRELDPPMFPSLPRVSYPKWIRDIAATTKVIVSDDKSAFVSDCGSPKAIEELARLHEAGEIGSIEGVWISHYHDDHTENRNVLRRRFGTKVFVQEELVDIIENPTAYRMPALFPESIKVDRVMRDGETIAWKEFRLTFYYFPGQTLYHAGLMVEKDGYKVFFTGDSITNWGVDDYCSQNRNFMGQNVGYRKCFDRLLAAKPDMLVAAHWGPEPISTDYVRKTIELFREREALEQKLFPHDNINFGLDPCWIRSYPYRQKALPGALVAVEARIMNHSSVPKKAQAELVLPAGWTARQPSGAQEIPANTEGVIRLLAAAPANPPRRRQVIGLSVTFGGRRIGEFAEAIVDFLETEPRS